MLATQFSDYDLGPTRHAIMGEVLGDGIVCPYLTIDRGR